MPPIAEMLALAMQHHQAGALPEAERLYRQILQRDPQHIDALHLLGFIAHQVGKNDIAIDYIRQAVRLKPDFAEAHFNLANALREQGTLAEAIACYRAAIVLKPDYVEAHNNLGNALIRQEKVEEAIACYRQALVFKVDFLQAHNNLGSALMKQGRVAEAVASYRQAVLVAPNCAEAHSNLGDALTKQEKWQEAVACFRQALLLNPDLIDTRNNLGNALKEQGKFEEAVVCYRQVLVRKPECPEAHNNLGTIFNEKERWAEAAACFRLALVHKPDYPEAFNNLGNALKELGELAEAVACYRRAVQLNPALVKTHHNLVFSLSYCVETTLADLAEAHAEFDRLHAAPLQSTWHPHENLRVAEKQLRLGFVSADLGRHPVGFFLARVLERLDRSQAEIVCYSDRGARDEIAARFHAVAAHWRDVASWSHDRLAAQIRDDRIDILFDLAGHTAKNRLLVFARRPAPIQITWAGYVGTTGLAAMDYILADRHQIPVEAQGHYREKVLRMPDGYICYDPPAYAPLVAELPALQRGCVTFGSFNNPTKLNRQILELWAEVLRRVPTSRLFLKYKGMDNPAVGERVRGILTGQGIEAERLELQGKSPHAELLAAYNRVDIALDPLPYNGGLTTCEALWMGVPVITCPGETFVGRHSLSHLSGVGLTEMVARDHRHYVELAVALAQDLPRLAALRAGLRARMAASPLCDAERFATHLLGLLREVWRSWAVQAPSGATRE